MRDAILAAVVPVLSAALLGLVGWVGRELRAMIVARTYAGHREALRVTADAVVADLAAHAVESAKGGAEWTPERQAEVRSLAVMRSKALEPLAVAALSPVLGAARLDDLVGTLVEQAVARAKVRRA